MIRLLRWLILAVAALWAGAGWAAVIWEDRSAIGVAALGSVAVVLALLLMWPFRKRVPKPRDPRLCQTCDWSEVSSGQQMVPHPPHPPLATAPPPAPPPYVPGGPVSAPPIFDDETLALVAQWKREGQLYLDAQAAAQARRREDAAQLAEAITERILDKLGPIIDALTESAGPRLSQSSHPSSAERPAGGER